jgi:outer membrane immunogenic protein
MFRRFLLASAGVIALSSAALAAEPLPPPPPPPPMWTGFYIGFNVGGTWSSNNTINTSAFPGPCDPGTGIMCTAVPNSSVTSAQLATFSVSHNNGGFIGGGQLGFNYQFANSWVAGIEADIQGLAVSNGNTTFVSTLTNPNFPVNPFLQTATVFRQVDYLGTLRGRLGLLATPTFLIYGTGGLAYGGVRANTTLSQLVVNSAISGQYFSFGSLNNTRVGWTAGGGVEWMFLPNWSLKVEYLYYDLGSVSFAQTPLVDFDVVTNTALSSAIVRSSTRFNGNIVRAGINYHFNWLPAPVVAKY